MYTFSLMFLIVCCSITNHHKMQRLKSAKVYLCMILQFGCDYLDSSSLLWCCHLGWLNTGLEDSFPRCPFLMAGKAAAGCWLGVQRELLWWFSLSPWDSPHSCPGFLIAMALQHGHHLSLVKAVTGQPVSMQ